MLSEYLTTFEFATLLNEYELMKVYVQKNWEHAKHHIVMSRTDAQKGLDFHFKNSVNT